MMFPAAIREHRMLIGCCLVGLVLVEYACNLLSTSLAVVSSGPFAQLLAKHDARRLRSALTDDRERQLLRAFDTLELSALEAENIALSNHATDEWFVRQVVAEKNASVIGYNSSWQGDAGVVTNAVIKVAETEDDAAHVQNATIIILNAVHASNVTSEMVICPKVPPTLVGRVKVVQKNDVHDLSDNGAVPKFFKWPYLEAQHRADLFDGGHFRPRACMARQKVAIVIPYRDRDQHLRIFTNHLLPILKRQLLDFKIYVVEQAGRKEKFNRGMLLNIGFVEALKDYAWQCVIFHDVDLLPENDKNMYVCDDKQPKHLSVAIDKFGYNLPYGFIMGGIEAFPVKAFRDINGFSNLYWGWGGEDDDLSKRIEVHPDYRLTRQDATVARYKMIKHSHVVSEEEPDRFKLLQATPKNMYHDGLSTLKYTLVGVEKRPLFTKLTVEIHISDYKQKL